MAISRDVLAQFHINIPGNRVALTAEFALQGGGTKKVTNDSRFKKYIGSAVPGTVKLETRERTER